MRKSRGPLAVLALSALLVAGCATATQAAHQAAHRAVTQVGVVPWVDRPAPAYLPLPQPRLAPAYPPCQAWQLAGRPGQGGPAAGTVYQEVRLVNNSDRPCTLSGGPASVTGVRATGGMATLARVAMGDGFNLAGPGPANLRPGGSGWITLAYGDGCPALTSGGRADYRTLLIAVDGGRVRVEFPAAVNLVCGLEVSRYGAPPPPPPSSRSPLNALTVSVSTPATLGAGATAVYAVTLRDHGGTPVLLAPCPSYIEYLGVFSGPGKPVHLASRYYLNCAAIRRIGAHASVTFAMRIHVPDGAGQAKLDWQLQGTQVATAAIVTVRGRRQDPENASHRQSSMS